MPRTIGVIISSLAVLGFTSIAAAAPFATNIAVDVAAQDLLIQVDFKCRKVDGQIVCGSTKSNKTATMMTTTMMTTSRRSPRTRNPQDLREESQL